MTAQICAQIFVVSGIVPRGVLIVSVSKKMDAKQCLCSGIINYGSLSVYSELARRDGECLNCCRVEPGECRI